MKLYLAYVIFTVCVGALIVIAIAGCTSTDPTGPDITVANNTAPVNVTTGSSSPVGTAPCGAASSQKNVTPSGPSGDCSVDNSVSTPTP